ncbi:hypothetical protein D3C73_1165300 [compost metagenome]
MQRERSPNVFGVRRRDGVLLQLEPGGGHVLEGVFRLRSFGFVLCIALHLGINALCKQLARFNYFFPSAR